MPMIDAVISGLRQYADFRGTATRSQYWLWTLFVATMMIVIPLLEALVWPESVVTNLGNEFTLIPRSTLLVSEIFDIAVLVPQLAITARRFRDAGVSPTWVWVQMVNVPIILLVLYGSFANAVINSESSLYPVAIQELHAFWAMTGMFPTLWPTVFVGFFYGIFQTIVTLRRTKIRWDAAPEPR